MKTVKTVKMNIALSLMFALSWAFVTSSAASAKLGYIDRTGKLVIPAQFDEADKFTDTIAQVKKNNKAYYIDTTGKVVLDPKSAFAGSFSEGFASVQKGKDYVYIDKTGKQVINKSFEHALGFADGLAMVWGDNGRWGFIDHEGNFVIKPQYTSGGTFTEGLACMLKGEKFGFINKNGQEAIKFDLLDAQPFHDGVAKVQRTMAGKCVYIDKTGKTVIAPKYSETYDFSEGLAPASDGKHFFFIGKDGKPAFKETFAEVDQFAEGLAPASNGKSWGFIDKKGTWVIKPAFKRAYSFSGGFAAVDPG